MLFDMKIGQRQFAYITTYKPPSLDNNTFKRELCNLLDEANSLSDNVIFTGDLNSDKLIYQHCLSLSHTCLMILTMYIGVGINSTIKSWTLLRPR